MNELLFQIGSSSCTMLLLKATLVLAIGWVVHFCINPIHAQWRCRLWRFGSLLLIATLALSFLPSQLNVVIQRDAIVALHDEITDSGQLTNDRTIAPKELDLSPVSTTVPRTPSSPKSSHETANSINLPPPPNFEIGKAKEDSHTPYNAVASTFVSNSSSWLAGIWIAGIVFFVVCRILVAVTAYRKICITEPISGAATRTYHEVADAMNVIKAPPLYLASGLNSPCLMLFPKMQIILPEFIADDSEFDTRSVFAHELAHYKRRDWHWNLLFQMLSICLWFHPLAWKISEIHLNECENACDDMASKITGNRLEYQQSLAQIAFNVQSHAAVGLSMARKSKIMLRLRRLETPLRRVSARQLLFLFTLLPAVSVAAGLFGFNFVAPTSISIQEPAETQKDSNELTLTIAGVPKDKLDSATVEISFHYKDANKRNKVTLKPDDEGNVSYTFDDSMTLNLLIVVCRAPGYVPHAIQRNSRHSKIIVPANYEANLNEGRSIRGTVKDMDGRPVAGALVELDMKVQDTDDGSFAFDLANLKSDANGNWSADVAPWYLQASGVHGKASHPDYLSAWTSSANVATDDASFDAVLQKGTTFIGKVVDEKGNPMAGATVSLGSPAMSNAKIVKSDMGGEFRLENCRVHQNYLVATIPGFAPTLQEIKIEEKQAVEDRPKLVMKPGQKLEATIKDQYGEPAVGIRVGIQDWRKSHSLDFVTRTDENGKFVMEDAPEDGVWFTFGGKEHRLIVHHELFAGRADQVVTLNRKQTVKFKVLDEKTGKPVPLGWMRRGMKWTEDKDRAFWDAKVRYFQDGEFEYTFIRQVAECWLRVGSQGYESQLFKFKLGEPDKEVTVKLKFFASKRDQDWETVRTRIEDNSLPMGLEADANYLRDKGANVRVEKDGDWHIGFGDKYTIQSSMFGVPNITEDVSRKTWKGSIEQIAEIKNLPRVRLTLKGFMINSELVETLNDCENILSIDFVDCPLEMIDEDWADFSKLTALEEISLDGRWQDFPKAAARALAALPKLQKLEFGGVGAFHMDSETFADELSKMQSLKHLSLSSHNDFDNRIGVGIQKLKNLESLGIQGKAIDSQFVKSLKGLHLKSLKLFRTSIDDQGLRLIADQFEDLEVLDIVRTKVTPDGIRDNSTRLNKLKRLVVDEMEREALVRFKISHPHCIIEQIRHIVGGVSSMPAFELTDEEKKQIEKQVPE